MFSLASGLYAEYFSPQQLNLLVVGVQSSGKTTLLERIKVTEFATHSTTEGSGSSSAAGKTTGAPEMLRTQIFLSDHPQQYDAPPAAAHTAPSRHRKHHHQQQQLQQQQQPASRFAWICPPPPKFLLRQAGVGGARLDNSSDRGDGLSHLLMNDSDIIIDAAENGEDNDEYYDDQPEDDDDDDDDDHSYRSNQRLLEEQQPRSRVTGAVAGLQRKTSKPFEPKTTAACSVAATHPPGLPSPRRISAAHNNLKGSTTFHTLLSTADNDDNPLRMDSVELGQPSEQRQYDNDEEGGDNGKNDRNDDGDDETDFVEFDVKKNAKMLPLIKIRPTIGMNLGKTEICGAKVHVWDLGGRLQDLWERYYADADAVLFVWKLQRPPPRNRQTPNPEDDENGSDDDDHRYRYVSAEQQRKVLEQVRSAVPDDVPFLILGHVFQIHMPLYCESDVLYSTSQLLQFYHNPYQALFLGNAKTGQGIKTALEWLMSTAKRQQKIRNLNVERH